MLSSMNCSLRWLLIAATAFVVTNATETRVSHQDLEDATVKKSFSSPLAGETFHVLKECSDTDGGYTLLKVDIPSNVTSVPFHHHDRYDEYITVVGDGPYHTIIAGVNKTYHKGETFAFPVHIEHLWWTDDQATEIYHKMMPCFDGFHDSIEIYSKLQEEKLDPTTRRVTDLWTTAVLYSMGGTVIEYRKWYLRPLLWFLKALASSQWGKQLEKELREQYVVDAGNEQQQRPDETANEL